MSQLFDAALQELALDVEALGKRAQELQLRVGELRALRRQERQASDPDLPERRRRGFLQEVRS